MKILILDNIFHNSKYIKIITSRNLYNFVLYYKNIKLKSLIIKLRKKYGKEIEIKIISDSFRPFYIYDNIHVELFSDYRIVLEREKFLKINEKVIKNSKKNLYTFFTNLLELKTFHIDGIFLGTLLEYNIASFFKEIFIEYELLIQLLQSEKYDKVILFNYNPNFMSFFKSLNRKFKNIEVSKDFLLTKYFKIPKWFFSKYLIKTIIFSLKIIFNKKFQKKLTSPSIDKKNIIFIIESKNQFKAVESLVELIKSSEIFNPIFFSEKNYIPLNRINKLIKFLFQISNIWQYNIKKITSNLKYNALNLEGAIQEYFNYGLIFNFLRIFSNLSQINEFFEYFPPNLVVLADNMKLEPRLYAKYCRLKDIPTIYIPHGAIPVYDEWVSKSDFYFIAAPGEQDKKYLVQKGEPEKKIIVTGRPSYDNFFKGNIKKLSEVQDMFSNRKYKFDKDKFTILLATSPVDYKAREKLLSIVIQSLKELNLIDNLIIKLHPSEDGIIHKEILKYFNVDPILVRDYNILDLLKSSDLFLSRSSTTILEAMLIGTPLILLDLINLKAYFSGTYLFCRDSNVISVKNQNELTQQLKQLINDEEYYSKYRKCIKDLANGYAFFNKEKTSSEIIYDLIKSLAI